ncbi:phosphohydrolase [Rhizobium sp. L51/94]|nr:phosphohydrolase [Rhizobium sp. L51/94]
MDRIGDWMQTYTGRKFWPLDPRANEIDIRDIAHSLAMQCRYAGHCENFFSVAEHSVLIADHLDEQGQDAETCLWGLLHDGEEAYLPDMIRPTKSSFPGYGDASAVVTLAICERFGLPPLKPAVVKQADDRILADEKEQNLRALKWDYEPGPALGVTLRFWRPAKAEIHFLNCFYRLRGRMGP